MSKEKTTSKSRKHKQEKGSTPNGDTHLAAGGELHQIAGGKHPALTTNQGLALSDNQNSLKHARATGVHGFFELTASLKQYTTARILTEVGEKTPVFTRIRACARGRKREIEYADFRAGDARAEHNPAREASPV